MIKKSFYSQKEFLFYNSTFLDGEEQINVITTELILKQTYQ